MFCRRFQRPFAEGAGVQPTLRRAVLHLRQRGPTFLDRATVFVGRVWRLLRRRKQVCLPPSFCLVSTPVPNHPHYVPLLIAARGKEGTSILSGQGRLPPAACSCSAAEPNSSQFFRVRLGKPETNSVCELGLTVPDRQLLAERDPVWRCGAREASITKLPYPIACLLY